MMNFIVIFGTGILLFLFYRKYSFKQHSLTIGINYFSLISKLQEQGLITEEELNKSIKTLREKGASIITFDFIDKQFFSLGLFRPGIIIGTKATENRVIIGQTLIKGSSFTYSELILNQKLDVIYNKGIINIYFGDELIFRIDQIFFKPFYSLIAYINMTGLRGFKNLDKIVKKYSQKFPDHEIKLDEWYLESFLLLNRDSFTLQLNSKSSIETVVT